MPTLNYMPDEDAKSTTSKRSKTKRKRSNLNVGVLNFPVSPHQQT